MDYGRNRHSREEEEEIPNVISIRILFQFPLLSGCLRVPSFSEFGECVYAVLRLLEAQLHKSK